MKENKTSERQEINRRKRSFLIYMLVFALIVGTSFVLPSKLTGTKVKDHYAYGLYDIVTERVHMGEVYVDEPEPIYGSEPPGGDGSTGEIADDIHEDTEAPVHTYITPYLNVSINSTYYYGESINPSVSTNSNGTKTIEYKQNGKADSTYTTAKPTEVGEYVLRVKVSGTYTYYSASTTKKFSILKIKNIKASVTCPDTEVGGSYEPTVQTESDSTSYTFAYKVKGSADSTYSGTKPSAAGEYTVRATIAASAHYEEHTATADFKITKKIATTSVSVADSFVGDEYAPVLTTDSDGKDKAVFEYKKADDADSAYAGAKPTAAGEYTVRATVPETDIYEEAVCEGSFKISKTVGTATVSVADSFVGDEYAPVLTTDSDGKDKAVFEYKKADDADSAYASAKPTAAGKYNVRATVPETDKYEEQIATGSFEISKRKATATVSVPDTVIGTEYEPSFTTDSDGKATFEYKKADADDSAYSSALPEAAGSYTVRVTIPETDKYLETSATSSFTISKIGTGKATVTVPDSLVGATYEPTLTTDSDGKDKAVFEYKKNGDETYSSAKPTAAGKYTVRVTIPETDKYLEITATSSFTISKIFTGTASISISDVTVGTDYNPILTTDSDGKALTFMEYKKQGADDSTYTRTKPTEVGSYVVRATVPETDRYEKIVCTASFAIKEKAVDPDDPSTTETPVNPVDPTTGKKEMVVDLAHTEQFYYGTNYSLSFRVVDGIGSYVSPDVFKLASAETAWFSGLPSEPGTYDARIFIKGNQTYNDFMMTVRFSVVYLPAPAEAYTFTGEKGNNDYFTGDVSINAPAGYRISYRLGDSYADSLAYTRDNGFVYLRRNSDGAMTGAVQIVENVKQDGEKPSLAQELYDENGKSLSASGSIYANLLNFAIQDAHLSVVRVDGKDVPVNNNRAEISVETNGGARTVRIEAEDEAGNTFATNLVFMAAWMTDMTVPAGTQVLLQTGNTYNLSSGKWSMSGDSSIYTGGNVFYVRQDITETFSKLN